MVHGETLEGLYGVIMGYIGIIMGLYGQYLEAIVLERWCLPSFGDVEGLLLCVLFGYRGRLLQT